MAEQIRLLQAEIRDAISSIEEVYHHLDKLKVEINASNQDIVIGYYLHVLYGFFEHLFERISETFENHITDKTQWHVELLKRMKLEVKPTRPAVISQETFLCLNELLGFRHLFRNAYLLRFDPDRLNIVLQQAQRLKSLYRTDLEKFLDFLEQLASVEE